jgi:hypothetical protein
MQGDVVPSDAVDDWRAAGFVPAEWDAHADWLVVVSHSCDLAATDVEAEPWAEVVRGRTDEPADGNLTWGKNPRTLQIDAASDAPVTFSVHDRTRVPKHALQAHAPDSGRRLDTTERRCLAQWLGKRYVRAAFPDAFNDRVRPVASRLRKHLKKKGGALLGALYVLLNSDDELPEGVPYEMVLRGVMAVEDHESPEKRAEALATMKAVASELGRLPDVELIDWDLVSAAEMSLDDLDYFQRWDYDDLSDRTEGAARTPDP